MDAIFFYLIACLPLGVAAGFWYFDKRVILAEALILVGIGFVVAGAFHGIAISGMTSDVQTYSGQLITTTQHSAWQEGYDKEIYKTEHYTVTEHRTRTVGTGKNQRTESYTVEVRKSREVFSHLEPRTRWHNKSFDADDTLSRSYAVDEGRYLDVVSKFGDTRSFPGNRSNWGYRERNHHMIGGDPNDYSAVNKTGYVYPVTDVRSWENKVKACPSVFSYVKVPETMLPNLFTYPENSDKFISNRLVGAGGWSIVEWDQMNAHVGPSKKVNVISVNFGIGADSALAAWQEAHWIGGKKNDIVICFGGGESVIKPKWCHTFGWSEKEIVKRNIDTIILENGIVSKTIPLIEKEIQTNYEIKNWSKFDYLTVEIPGSYFLWCLIIELVLAGIWIIVALKNDVDK